MRRMQEFSVLSARFSVSPALTENWELRAENKLVKLLSWTKRHLVVLNWFLRLPGLRQFFAGAEDALFAAADALVSMQAFQDEFCGRHLLLSSVFRADVHFDGFLHQALDATQRGQCLAGARGIGQLNFSTKIEPL